MKMGNSQIPWFAPADSAGTGLWESSPRFGQEGAQAPLRFAASWGPDEGLACLYCIPDQTAGEIVILFISPYCLKKKFD